MGENSHGRLAVDKASQQKCLVSWFQRLAVSEAILTVFPTLYFAWKKIACKEQY